MQARNVLSSCPGPRIAPFAGGWWRASRKNTYNGLSGLSSNRQRFFSSAGGNNDNKTHVGRKNDMAPVVVVGGGVAGSAAALIMANAGFPVTVLTLTKDIRDCASLWAQGGIIYKGLLDSPQQLGKDIHAAGAGISTPSAVEQLGNMGPSAVEEILLELCQTNFERSSSGDLKLTLEAAHSVPRIIYTGDFTGRTITESMQKVLLEHPNITWMARHVVDLVVKDGGCIGLKTLDENDEQEVMAASQVVLATGGIGEVYSRTSNPASACGEGIALAKRAGAEVSNMEYVQFHPTTFQPEGSRAFLLTEALRGEGAILRNHLGEAFAKNYDPRGELAPRDVVARLMWNEMIRTGKPNVYLDITHKDSAWLEKRFPSIHERCIKHGYHIGEHHIPVAPAAHYHCGGVSVDLDGRTNVPGLYCAGEVACTGVHGANRLASTSLLEALVWGKSVATAVIKGGLTEKRLDLGDMLPCENGEVSQERVDELWKHLQQTMQTYVGVIRTDDGLAEGLRLMTEIEDEAAGLYRKKKSRSLASLWNATETAKLVAKAALENENSLGAHYRLAPEEPPRIFTDYEMIPEGIPGYPRESTPAQHFA